MKINYAPLGQLYYKWSQVIEVMDNHEKSRPPIIVGGTSLETKRWAKKKKAIERKEEKLRETMNKEYFRLRDRK